MTTVMDLKMLMNVDGDGEKGTRPDDEGGIKDQTPKPVANEHIFANFAIPDWVAVTSTSTVFVFEGHSEGEDDKCGFKNQRVKPVNREEGRKPLIGYICRVVWYLKLFLSLSILVLVQCDANL